MNQNTPLQIAIGLDLSEIDQFLIKYVKNLDHILPIKKVFFLHNIKMGEIPKDLLVPEKISQIISRIENRIQTQIEEIALNFPYEIIIKMDSYSETAFINLNKTSPFDLLILGNKQEFEGNGGLAQKLVRVLPCATLLIPETLHYPITTIIDAIDFSKYTNSIMSWADYFKNNSKGQKIYHSAVYVSKFNWSFLPSITDKDIKKETLLDVERKRNTWNQKYSNYSDITIITANDKSIATVLLNYAKDKKAAMIILGVKGNAGLKGLFMGSVAHDIFQRPTDSGILFVK